MRVLRKEGDSIGVIAFLACLLLKLALEELEIGSSKSLGSSGIERAVSKLRWVDLKLILRSDSWLRFHLLQSIAESLDYRA